MDDKSLIRMEKIENIFHYNFYYLDDFGRTYERFSDVPKWIYVSVKKKA